MKHGITLAFLFFSAAMAAQAGCGKNEPSFLPDGGQKADLAGGVSGDMASSTGDDPQTPPQGGAALTSWLQAGYYKSWHCEAAQHPAGLHGAHGANRVCSNNVLAAAGTTGEFPVGSASVKELYSGTNVVGYAVSLRIKTGPTGDSWYWNENGFGGVGVGGCTGCHSLAGSGGTYYGRDFVFIRVP